MTQPPVAGPTVFLPSAGVCLAKLVRRASQAEAVSVQYGAIDKYWAEYMDKCDQLMEAMYPTPVPADRLRIYQNKPITVAPPPPPMLDAKGLPMPGPPAPPPPASWHEQRARFPLDFRDQMKDWVQLEPVSVRRDQVMRELAALDIQEEMAQANTAMSAPPLQQPPAFSDAAAPPPEQWPK